MQEMRLRVAIVTRDPRVRDEAARAFDAAPAQWRVALHEVPPQDADVIVWGPDTPGGSGVRFVPGGAANLVDEVRKAAAAAGAAPVVAVTSAGGGSGVTSVALHLARCWARRGKRTCYVDLDLRWGAHRRLGLEPTSVRSWAGAQHGAEALGLAALPLPGGFRALLAPAETVCDTPPSVVVAGARAQFQRIVVDVPFGDDSAGVLRDSFAVVVLLTPSSPAAARAAALLSELPADCGVIVVNRLGAGGEMTASKLARLLGYPVTAELPCCPALRDAEDGGRLLSPSLTRWARRVDRLAGALEDAIEKAKA